MVAWYFKENYEDTVSRKTVDISNSNRILFPGIGLIRRVWLNIIVKHISHSLGRKEDPRACSLWNPRKKPDRLLV